MDFNNLDELYNRVLPALSIKKKEMNDLVTEKELWDYLSKTKWINAVNLTLYDIVNDILNCNINEIKK